MTTILKDTAGTAANTLPTGVMRTDETPNSTPTVIAPNPSKPFGYTVPSGSPDDFLSRPIVIVNTAWSGAFALTRYDPWKLYMDDPLVRSKLTGYSRFRATMNIRATVSGTPFHYGALMLSSEYCSNNNYKCNVALNSMIKRSQLPHILLNPSTNTVADMVIPRLYHKPYSSLQGNIEVDISVLYLEAMNDLEMINAATPTPVNVIIYAWLTDVELDGASPTLGTIVGQMKTTYKRGGSNKAPKSDEHSKGPLSRVASAVAGAAGALTSIPGIAPWAQAASIGAEAMSSVLSLFGYSKATDISGASIVKVGQFDQFGLCIGLDQSQKLTVDPKCALSLSNAPIGADYGDELAIASIAGRESYITSLNWSSSDVSGAVLATFPVRPLYCVSNAVTNGSRYEMTPINFATLPFAQWTGTIIYKIMIMGAALHTGKLRVTWLPDGAAAPTDYNSCYSQIIDIADTREFCCSVAMAQSSPWLDTGSLGVTYSALDSNGRIHITVLNELGTIVSTQGVYINVYMKCGEDFQLSQPRLTYLNTSDFTLIAPQMKRVDIGATAPNVCESPDVPLVPGEVSTDISLAYNGEVIPSYRLLLKRPTYYRNFGVIGTTVFTGDYSYIMTYTLPVFPTSPGFASTGLDRTTLSAAYNYSGMTLLTYVGSAFHGWKGSLRWKINMTDSATSIVNTQYYVQLPANDTTAGVDGVRGTVTQVSMLVGPSVRANSELTTLGNLGQVVAMGATPNVGGLEIETPPYNKRLYNVHRPGTNASPGAGPQTVTISRVWCDSNSSNKCIQDRTFVCASDDFNFVTFICAPTLYIIGTQPTPNATT